MNRVKKLLSISCLTAIIVMMGAMPAQADFQVGGSTASVAALQDHAEKTLKKRMLRKNYHGRNRQYRHHRRVKKHTNKSVHNTHVDSMGLNN